ncbi:phage tail protein [Massilia sp. YIM B02763]|uniref:phage tail protein n=1 Tax=Massilia sp. YIM B02763 TaxID=3050130 RepID=UPI0025B6EF4D|nr:phage tail protein [Massilia sp. YIM B02763]MDN4056342.1 phage tail protein [Massilia sp. YIM B02763]
MSTYYSLPTAAGEAELAGALAAQKTVPFTHIAVGDGNGAQVVPDGRTALVHQVDIVPISSIRQHPAHANWIVLEAAIPEDRGGYTIRELAVVGGRTAGTVLAIGNYPDLEKPLPSSGAASATVLRMVVAFEHGTAAINLTVDPQAYATLQAVLDQIAAHEAKADPHPQYMTSDEATSMLGDALAAHLRAQDPHSQYWTGDEGQAAVDGAMATHLAAADPHPQYINADRLAQSAANNWAEEFFRLAN